ncbi:hypothetical protein GQ54DRAFT_35431 [Martensiomyces pterosporus]|nr:hypothetical protein GQ54DRAFT_35431 [Martensiomyces pterosporus]
MSGYCYAESLCSPARRAPSSLASTSEFTSYSAWGYRLRDGTADKMRCKTLPQHTAPRVPGYSTHTNVKAVPNPAVRIREMYNGYAAHSSTLVVPEDALDGSCSVLPSDSNSRLNTLSEQLSHPTATSDSSCTLACSEATSSSTACRGRNSSSTACRGRDSSSTAGSGKSGRDEQDSSKRIVAKWKALFKRLHADARQPKGSTDMESADYMWPQPLRSPLTLVHSSNYDNAVTWKGAISRNERQRNQSMWTSVGADGWVKHRAGSEHNAR